MRLVHVAIVYDYLLAFLVMSRRMNAGDGGRWLHMFMRYCSCSCRGTDTIEVEVEVVGTGPLLLLAWMWLFVGGAPCMVVMMIEMRFAECR